MGVDGFTSVEQALDAIRRCAALGERCDEDLGVAGREIDETITAGEEAHRWLLELEAFARDRGWVRLQPLRPDVPAPLELVIPGRFLPEQKRHRRVGQWQRRVDTPQARDWKAKAALAGQQAMRGRPLFDEPIRLDVIWYMRKPASYPKKRNRPHKKPDRSNLLKILEDALNEIVWTDDALICEGESVKCFGEPERVELRVQVLEPEWPYRRG